MYSEQLHSLIDELRQDLEHKSTKLTAICSDLTAAKSQFTEQAYIAELEAKLSTYSEKLEKTTADLVECKARVSKLEKEVCELKKNPEIDLVKNAMRIANAELAALRAENSELRRSRSLHNYADANIMDTAQIYAMGMSESKPLQIGFHGNTMVAGPNCIRDTTFMSENSGRNRLWDHDTIKAFHEANEVIPKEGIRKFHYNGVKKGRNQHIANYINKRCNTNLTAAQVSSFLQKITRARQFGDLTLY
ncbi:unnamed protein product [Caenorhabditis bovis]|uniref:TEA domain-containing protein n=1 Tax=Caenorhabditis bovis TaxID=2654633 RepID=A0A8S1FAF7_9PELO|nr:unnamed protein product [Caenorhabditis bovis]